jgi:hypothetical protein
VQIAVSAVNVLCAVRATRNMPLEVWTSAAPPTVANGDAESIVIDTTPFATLALMVGSGGACDGDVGLPPHPVNIDPSAASDTAPYACTQNVRRVSASGVKLS